MISSFSRQDQPAASWPRLWCSKQRGTWGVCVTFYCPIRALGKGVDECGRNQQGANGRASEMQGRHDFAAAQRVGVEKRPAALCAMGLDPCGRGAVGLCVAWLASPTSPVGSVHASGGRTQRLPRLPVQAGPQQRSREGAAEERETHTQCSGCRLSIFDLSVSEAVALGVAWQLAANNEKKSVEALGLLAILGPPAMSGQKTTEPSADGPLTRSNKEHDRPEASPLARFAEG
jgi:hypothetical protein